LGFWVISRHADVAKLLADTTLDFYSRDMYARIRDATEDPTSPTAKIARWLMLTDRREHRRFRGLLNRYFTPAAVESATGIIRARVCELLDRMPTDQSTDFVAGLARPLPMNVLCDWLGIPEADRERCRDWAAAIGRVLISALNPMVIRGMGEALLACDEYLRGLIAQRRQVPRDDLLSKLLTAEHAGEQITEDELVADVVLLLGASSETTVNMLSLGVYTLLCHPDALAILREDPSITRNAVDELLRFDSPAQLAGRYTAHDLDVGGNVVPAGSRLSLLIGAAHRDPARYEKPDQLDLYRSDPRPLSFGAGSHHCIGAWLARLEVETALRMLLERFPEIHLAGSAVQWRSDAVALRAPAALPVRVSVR
jgi:cytochrome P450